MPVDLFCWPAGYFMPIPEVMVVVEGMVVVVDMVVVEGMVVVLGIVVVEDMVVVLGIVVVEAILVPVVMVAACAAAASERMRSAVNAIFCFICFSPLQCVFTIAFHKACQDHK